MKLAALVPLVLGLDLASMCCPPAPDTAHVAPPLPPPRRIVHVVHALPHLGSCLPGKFDHVGMSLVRAGVDLPSNVHVTSRAVCEVLAAGRGAGTGPLRTFVAEIDVVYALRAPGCPPRSSAEIICHGWMVIPFGRLGRLVPARDEAEADLLRAAIVANGFPADALRDGP
jgi:hypothetical protein